MSIKILPYVTVYHFGTIFVQDYFGGPLLTMFYITAITLLAEKARAYRLLHPLSYVGRMSMSNYLFQSIVCTSIFYSYGLGLYGSVSYTTGFLFLIARVFPSNPAQLIVDEACIDTDRLNMYGVLLHMVKSRL